MGPAPTRDYPSDVETVGLVALHGSYIGVDRAMGYLEGTTLRRFGTQSRRAARVTCDAFVRPPSTHAGPRHSYPDDAEMLRLMGEHRSFAGVARAVGRRRESLRDYLSRRPELDERMRERLRPRLTPEQKRDNGLRHGREFMRRRRLIDPPTMRARRRLSMAGTKPPGTKPALDPDMNAYARILRADPCAYCGATAEHIDHIEPIAKGGALRWDNLTAACASCNHRKRTRSLLVYLAGRG